MSKAALRTFSNIPPVLALRGAGKEGEKEEDDTDANGVELDAVVWYAAVFKYEPAAM